ncbi:ATP-dependent DNA helicase RecG [Enterovirga rhinocerotis]|uniref:ATP-dependent DNA helicase RecG n=1 Tax=Enterovirga rhinocerotis TaxID=1339210 RepID=A0A4R7C893_9HYPH|nr:ATP-dependent DNA helicase RecG [Enterovirga rhinocerotis]TDR94581.1 ATP-dependent DNA helicase RecG [Enterovirga rhinocerotis]
MSLRPALLDPVFAPLSSLAGIGPKVAAAFDRLLGEPGRPARVVDLLLHLPSASVTRELMGSIAEAPAGTPVTLAVQVTSHRPPPPGRGRAPFRVLVEDGTGDVTLVFFGLPAPRVVSMLPIGARRFVSGTIELYDGQRQMVHPARILDESRAESAGESEPVYGLTEGLSSRLVAKHAGTALAKLPPLAEWQDPAWLSQQGWPPFAEALKAAHAGAGEPQREGEEAPPDPARRRLAYDEILASQLALALVRAANRSRRGRPNAGDGSLMRRITEALPFPLTGAQERAIGEIRRDLKSEERMLRLLQGDVGAGKTLVALLAMASAVEAGRQAALVAPTEILARQHAERIATMAEPAGLRIGILTGRDKTRERRETLAALAEGRIDIVVGTHALLQGEVAFRDLGLAVIDEQHRFGVHQRLALGQKGEAVDMLVMTATPIPRTLALSAFGDMDISVLDEKPPGRRPIDTRLVSSDRLDEVTDAVARAIGRGDLVYWVCPLVQESEAVDLAAAEDRHRDLAAVLGEDAVGLVHGRMAPRDKDAVMTRFQGGEIKVLVSTTVIEVGVDVSRATVMVIEHAERFGLAQLHQLRGRVGRGERPSVCLLLYKGPLGEAAKARLETLRRTENGFEIAEEDLRLRGEGELLGTRQAGAANFRIARLDTDADLLPAARDDARLIVERDPTLSGERGEALRLLLYLFERDAGVRLLRAG